MGLDICEVIYYLEARDWPRLCRCGTSMFQIGWFGAYLGLIQLDGQDFISDIARVDGSYCLCVEEPVIPLTLQCLDD